MASPTQKRLLALRPFLRQGVLPVLLVALPVVSACDEPVVQSTFQPGTGNGPTAREALEAKPAAESPPPVEFQEAEFVESERQAIHASAL